MTAPACDELAALQAENAALRAKVVRLEEEIGFWERGSRARILGVAPDQWLAVKNVVAAALRWCSAPTTVHAHQLRMAVDELDSARAILDKVSDAPP